MKVELQQTPVVQPLPQQRMIPKLMAVNAVLVLPLPELEARIEEELAQNPALERDHTLCPRCGTEMHGLLCTSCGHLLGEPLGDDPVVLARGPEDEEFDPIAHVAAEVPLHEHLMLQLVARNLRGKRQHIGEFLIGCIDPRGYLAVDLDEVAARFRVRRAVVEQVLGIIQEFDPPGVGARSVEECLLLQLRSQDPTPHNLLARRIVETGCLLDMGRGRYAKVAERLNSTPQEVREAHAYIRRTCYPYPADRYEVERTGGGVRRPEEVPRPDVVIVRHPGGYAVEVTGSSTMGLRLSEVYRGLLRAARRNPQDLPLHAREHIREYVNRAKLFIETVKRRNWTLRRIFEVIVAAQREFLDRGPQYLKPLTLSAVARELGISESTVSRALDGKYVQLPSGRVVPSTLFFESALPIKERIRTMVANEDPEHPLTDQEIIAALRREGIRIARRTAAKYREEMGIPASSARRSASRRSIASM